MFTILFGKSLERDAKDFDEISANIREGTSNIGLGLLGNMLFENTMFVNWSIVDEPIKRFESHISRAINVLKKHYLENKAKYDENNLVTYCDHLIHETSTRINLSDDKISTDLFAIIGGGIDSTSFTSEYSLVLLGKYPVIQQTVYNELHEIFGETKKFLFSKLNECALLRAFVNEVLRISSAAPTNVPHGVAQDYEFELTPNNILDHKNNQKFFGQKYIIPTNAIIMTNLLFISNNKYNSDVWDQVRPENINNPNITLKCGEVNLGYWLKYDSKSQKYNFVSCKETIPFSLGKRSCPGRALAEKELYCIIANIILNYEMRLVDPNVTIETNMSLAQDIHPAIGLIPIKR